MDERTVLLIGPSGGGKSVLLAAIAHAFRHGGTQEIRVEGISEQAQANQATLAKHDASVPKTPHPGAERFGFGFASFKSWDKLRSYFKLTGDRAVENGDINNKAEVFAVLSKTNGVRYKIVSTAGESYFRAGNFGTTILTQLTYQPIIAVINPFHRNEAIAIKAYFSLVAGLCACMTANLLDHCATAAFLLFNIDKAAFAKECAGIQNFAAVFNNDSSYENLMITYKDGASLRDFPDNTPNEIPPAIAESFEAKWQMPKVELSPDQYPKAYEKRMDDIRTHAPVAEKMILNVIYLIAKKLATERIEATGFRYQELNVVVRNHPDCLLVFSHLDLFRYMRGLNESEVISEAQNILRQSDYRLKQIYAHPYLSLSVGAKHIDQNDDASNQNLREITVIDEIAKEIVSEAVELSNSSLTRSRLKFRAKHALALAAAMIGVALVICATWTMSSMNKSIDRVQNTLGKLDSQISDVSKYPDTIVGRAHEIDMRHATSEISSDVATVSELVKKIQYNANQLKNTAHEGNSMISSDEKIECDKLIKSAEIDLETVPQRLKTLQVKLRQISEAESLFYRKVINENKFSHFNEVFAKLVTDIDSFKKQIGTWKNVNINEQLSKSFDVYSLTLSINGCADNLTDLSKTIADIFSPQPPPAK